MTLPDEAPDYSTAVYPYDAVVYITDNFSGTSQEFRGSGVIIGPHTILTASHVLWSSVYGAASNVSAYPAYNNGGSPIAGQYIFHYFEVSDQPTISQQQSQFDYAIIDFATDLSNYGWFGISTDYNGGTVHATGYPASAGLVQTDSLGTVTKDQNYSVLDYGTLSTSPGNSGGPLWFDSGTSANPLPYVVGVVSTGSWATEITAADLTQIQAWEAADSHLWSTPALPTITSNGGGDAAAVSIAENTTAVTTVTATETGVATLSYSIIGGADASKFTIGASTGALSFATAPNFEAPTDAGGNNVYDVTVKVSDGQGGIDTQAIAVTVTDVNEGPIHGRVERFFDSATNDHFYTASLAEANQIRATLPTYHDEGSPWGTPDKGTNTVDVFRFFDSATGDHFYTNSAAERNNIIAHNPTYHFEGVAFEAYTVPAAGTLTLERFFNTIYGVHHYSASAAETAAINAGAVGPGWVEEGPGFIVHT
jgi:V8-like Glu-specific endopeptidase